MSFLRRHTLQSKTNFSTAPVTISGTGDSSCCYVIVNGTTYTADANVTAQKNDTITLFVSTGGDKTASITIDGTTETTSSSLTKTYTIKNSGGCTISLTVTQGGSGKNKFNYGSITVITAQFLNV